MKTPLLQAKENLVEQILSHGFSKEIPAQEATIQSMMQELFQLFFPIYQQALPEYMVLEQRYLNVQKFFHELNRPWAEQGCCKSKQVEEAMFNQLPEILNRLYQDAEAILNGDPAAHSIEEVIHTYPGFYAIFVHRIAHVVHHLNMPILARMISEHAHQMTGIDIHPGAEIGHSFSIDHGTGIVIGETAIIGNHVKLYQGVTLGAKSVEKHLASQKRHPTIEDHVVLYAGATILGGETRIGSGSVIGGNVFLTKSVPPGSMVYHQNKIIVKPIVETLKQVDLKEEIASCLN